MNVDDKQLELELIEKRERLFHAFYIFILKFHVFKST